jgi:hypothetical protein
MSMRQIVAILLCLLAIPASAAGAPAKAARISIQWEYHGFPLHVILYEPKGVAPLWETRSVASLAQAPVGASIQDPVLMIAPGQARRFVLVVQNTTDRKLYFFAAPHVVQPPEQAVGFKFKCLCVNRVYTVGPHETWYRVVEFHVSSGFAWDGLTVTHVITGIDEKTAQTFSKDASMPEF